MAVSSTHTGWRKDKANSRLDVYYEGTRVGSFSASGQETATGRADYSCITASACNTDGAIIKIGSSSCGACSAVASTAACQTMHREIYGLGHGGAYGLYVRGYVTAGVAADAARIFGTISSGCATTVRGAHISLSHAACGAVSGLGVAMENTLHLPCTSVTGTISPLKVAIHSDGACSDPAGSALSYIQVVAQGDACGISDVDNDVALLHIQGHTVGASNMIIACTSECQFSHKIKIKVCGTAYYLMATNS